MRTEGVAALRTGLLLVALALALPWSAAAQAPSDLPAVTAPVAAQGSVPSAPMPSLVAPGIEGVVAAGTPVTLVADGFNGSEGPIGLPDGRLLFTETRANRIVAVDARDRVSSFLEDTNGANGLALDRRGRLYAVQTRVGAMRVGILHPATQARTLAAGFEGEPFNRPNDLVVDRRGGVYFTDPGQGLGPDVGKGRLPVSIYYIPAGQPVRRVSTGIAFPNGILLSRDERTLYVNDSRGRHLLAFDVGPGGALGQRRVFATYDDVREEADGTLRSGADGLAIDSEGLLYSATPAGVQVYDATGRHLGTIPTPRPAQNLAFAGPRKDVLYVVARGALFRIAMQSRGYAGRAK